ncbi:MAG: tannase/feruloyl esterase family alpha/beta hydrolase [Clostridia bacterium]|nr:tannase/feruloyl esterase family alpha/beta hydrolase [Clostridia bacterium]
MTDRIKNLLNADFENTQIISVSYENTGHFDDLTDLPPFYRVIFKTVCGRKSLIFTEMWLPDNWNGIYIAYGNGGMAGSINSKSLSHQMRNGYVTAQTDMGTSQGEAAGIDNPDMWKDFGWRATHYMAKIGKEIISTHYGKYPDYSYFDGASTGGQQAFSSAQRFPNDFDGIISAVPANNRVFLHTYFLWNHNHLRKPSGEVMFTHEQVSDITKIATEFFQNIDDGEKGDNFVSFPYVDKNTVAIFLSFLKKRKPEFSNEQIEALRAVYEGPKNPVTNKKIYNGMPIGSEIYGCGITECQNNRSPHYYPFIWSFGADYNPYDFDFDKDLEKISDKLSADLNANSTDLSAFFERGGKIISYSGSADPCVPFPDAMKYYERVIDSLGGYGEVSKSFRYFLMPGKDHGATGLGSNRLWGNEKRESLTKCIRNWVEHGIAPDYLIAERNINGENIFSRRLYPYCSEYNPRKPFMDCCDEYYLTK